MPGFFSGEILFMFVFQVWQQITSIANLGPKLMLRCRHRAMHVSWFTPIWVCICGYLWFKLIREPRESASTSASLSSLIFWKHMSSWARRSLLQHLCNLSALDFNEISWLPFRSCVVTITKFLVTDTLCFSQRCGQRIVFVLGTSDWSIHGDLQRPRMNRSLRPKCSDVDTTNSQLRGVQRNWNQQSFRRAPKEAVGTWWYVVIMGKETWQLSILWQSLIRKHHCCHHFSLLLVRKLR